MPLFNYQCNKCEAVVEKFLHNAKQDVEIKCECGSTEFSKLFGKTHSRTWLNARDMLNNKINPDVDRINKNINKGKDKDFLDIYGEK